MTEPPTSDPPRVTVTAEFLAETARKQAAYAASRQEHRERFSRLQDQAAADAAAPEKPRGRIPDRRQLGLDL